MSRFVNLELGGESEEPSRQSQPLAKDEAYYAGQAQAALESGDFERALRWFCKVLEFNPDNAGAWTGQVRMLIELGEHEEARMWADKALERFPHEPELLAAKGVALARAGDLEGAIAFSDSAIEERGDTPYVWLARGDVLLARRERRADYCLDKARMLAPRNWFITWLAARIRCYYRQFAAAWKLLQQALEENATQFVLWLELGRCQEALGLLGPAHISFSQAAQLNPDCRDASLALVRLSQGGLGKRLGGWWRRIFTS
jgi:tetratricopeptide (TPR) repeat protein